MVKEKFATEHGWIPALEFFIEREYCKKAKGSNEAYTGTCT